MVQGGSEFENSYTSDWGVWIFFRGQQSLSTLEVIWPIICLLKKRNLEMRCMIVLTKKLSRILFWMLSCRAMSTAPVMWDENSPWGVDRGHKTDEQERKEFCFYALSESEVAQSCPTLFDHMDCSLLVSSVHGIFQARILEWVAISFYRKSCPPRDRTQVSCIVDRCFTVWATREVFYALKSHRNRTPTVTKEGCLYVIFRQRNNYLWRFNETKGLILGVAD